uniref:Uncharacterized protein n=1 Tax=Romanomermis culicivorax TaxID=13658 RepID=A0A915JL34_ROMCU
MYVTDISIDPDRCVLEENYSFALKVTIQVAIQCFDYIVQATAIIDRQTIVDFLVIHHRIDEAVSTKKPRIFPQNTPFFDHRYTKADNASEDDQNARKNERRVIIFGFGINVLQAKTYCLYVRIILNFQDDNNDEKKKFKIEINLLEKTPHNSTRQSRFLIHELYTRATKFNLHSFILINGSIPAKGDPIKHANPRTNMSKPKALVNRFNPKCSTKITDVRQTNAAEKF